MRLTPVLDASPALHHALVADGWVPRAEGAAALRLASAVPAR